MPRLINAEKLAEYKASGVSDLTEWQQGWNDALDFVINEVPTIDAEPVVRCKDCKWGTPHPEDDEYIKCFKLCTTFYSWRYCSWGERREDGKTD